MPVILPGSAPMAAFAGIVSFDGAPLDNRIEQAIVAAAAGPRRQRVVVSRADHGIVAQRVVAPAASKDSSSLFVADVRLDNRTELIAALGATAPAKADDASLLFAMIERFGDAGVARCLGAFAFVHWRPEQRRLLLGRDCLGHRGLFYHRGDSFVAFASTLGGLLARARGAPPHA